MTNGDKPSPAPMAGLVGGLAACCAVHLLILGGVLAGISGFAVGGIAIGAGLSVAVLVWLVVALLRRRS